MTELTGPSDAVAARDPEVEAAEAAVAVMARDALTEVYDPEIGIDVVSLGLYYGCRLREDSTLEVDMTLTSPYCPLGSMIQTQVHAACVRIPGVEDVQVNLVWSPPWDPRTMASDEAKLQLGIY